MQKPAFVQENIVLAQHTTINLGGPARYFATCNSESDIKSALTWAKEEGIDIQVLSGGSNSIFADSGFDGLVLHINLKGIDWKDSGEVKVQAGENWDDFTKLCVEKSLAGVECMSGIPGNVGATPMQNVGAYGQEVAAIITHVTTLNRETCEQEIFTAADCQFNYRTSRFKTTNKNQHIITSVTFQLQENGEPNLSYPQVKEQLEKNGRSPSLVSIRETVLALRKSKSMIIDPADPNTHSCGSFFMNPLLSPAEVKTLETKTNLSLPQYPSADKITVPAAWFVEHAGFPKGTKRGGVGISTNHPLALININGTTSELLNFAKEIQTQVNKKFSVDLSIEPEIII